MSTALNVASGTTPYYHPQHSLYDRIVTLHAWTKNLYSFVAAGVMSPFVDAVVTYGVKRATVSDGMPLEGPVLAFSTPRDNLLCYWTEMIF